MDVRSLAFRTDLALLELGGSEVEDRGDHLVVRTPANPAFHWGNFLLLAAAPAVDEQTDWVERFDAEFPQAGHRAIGIDGTEGTAADLGGFAAAGLEIGVDTVMTADSVHPPPRPNTEARLRKLESDDDWAQRVDLAVACDTEYDEAPFREFVTRRAAYERGLTAAGHGDWWGAFVADRMVSGMGLVRAGDGLARFQDVQTHPEARGRGLAGTLVHHCSRDAFEHLGVHTLVMVADPDYLAIGVYRSVGFRDAERQSTVHQRES